MDGVEPNRDGRVIPALVMLLVRSRSSQIYTDRERATHRLRRILYTQTERDRHRSSQIYTESDRQTKIELDIHRERATDRHRSDIHRQRTSNRHEIHRDRVK